MAADSWPAHRAGYGESWGACSLATVQYKWRRGSATTRLKSTYWKAGVSGRVRMGLVCFTRMTLVCARMCFMLLVSLLWCLSHLSMTTLTHAVMLCTYLGLVVELWFIDLYNYAWVAQLWDWVEYKSFPCNFAALSRKLDQNFPRCYSFNLHYFQRITLCPFPKKVQMSS